MSLGEELAHVARAQRLVDDALAEIEPPLRRAQLRAMVAQGLIGATGFALMGGDGIPVEAAERLRERFAEADRANWALIDALKAARRAAEP